MGDIDHQPAADTVLQFPVGGSNSKHIIPRALARRRIVIDERVAVFVAQKCNAVITAPWTAVGLELAGEITAGVIFNGYSQADVNVTAAGSGWGKDVLREIGRYAFSTLKCERMTFLIEQSQVVEMSLRLGGAVEGVMRNHFGAGRDATVVGVLRSDWRF